MNLSTDLTDWDFMDYFLPMFIIGIGVALLVTGLFTSYFGAGKSQKIGFALFFLGIGTIASFIVFYPLEEDTLIEGLVSGISALIGLMIGMFIVLFVLMKVDTVDDLEDLDLEDLEDLDLDEELKKLEEELIQTENDSEDTKDDDVEETKKEDK